MKKLSPAQKKIAAKAKPKNKITGADFKKMKKKENVKNCYLKEIKQTKGY